MKGKGWFGLWQNMSAVLAHDYVQCMEEQMRLIYDPSIDDYRNLPGVETRVPKFGSARGFHDKNPLTPKECLDNLRDALEGLGYQDGDTLFGAPYDWRHAPPLPGQTSRAFTHYFKKLKALVEAASNKQGKKVILFGHSYGGMAVLEFVRNTPMAWRKKYIKHLFLAAPTLSSGFVQLLHGLISRSAKMMYVPDAASAVRKLWISFETAIAVLPSPKVFGHEPIVITQHKNYSAYDMEDLLSSIGLGDSIEPFTRKMIPRMNYFEAPMVPLTCINGVGNRTPRQLVFQHDNFEESPKLVYGDGDEVVNLISMLAFEKEMCRQPEQRKQFKSIKVHKARHTELVTAEWTINRVLPEIIAANRIF
ncbi:hypothetical protein QOZ80_7AG0566010 [Eleusine coracana subsp. coracana]|nr:hypothetical protein QOZ80_7AG0566010 [Eleusine coracana subsp. coracana]